MPENQSSTVKDAFVGTWKLLSFEFRRSDGVVTDVLGTNVSGMLIYDAYGHMSGQLMRPDRPHFASGDQQIGTPEEIKAALDGYIAYFGDYVIDEGEKSVTHQTKASLFPNLVGQDQKRFYAFSGNQLTLTTPPIRIGGNRVTGMLLWERYT
jgi:hypothetical protein